MTDAEADDRKRAQLQGVIDGMQREVNRLEAHRYGVPEEVRQRLADAREALARMERSK